VWPNAKFHGLWTNGIGGNLKAGFMMYKHELKTTGNHQQQMARVQVGMTLSATSAVITADAIHGLLVIPR